MCLPQTYDQFLQLNGGGDSLATSYTMLQQSGQSETKAALLPCFSVFLEYLCLDSYNWVVTQPSRILKLSFPRSSKCHCLMRAPVVAFSSLQDTKAEMGKMLHCGTWNPSRGSLQHGEAQAARSCKLTLPTATLSCQEDKSFLHMQNSSMSCFWKQIIRFW